MTTMNRFDRLYSERKPLAPLKKHEWSFTFICSFKAWDKRENCFFDMVPESGR